MAKENEQMEKSKSVGKKTKKKRRAKKVRLWDEYSSSTDTDDDDDELYVAEEEKNPGVRSGNHLDDDLRRFLLTHSSTSSIDVSNICF